MSLLPNGAPAAGRGSEHNARTRGSRGYRTRALKRARRLSPLLTRLSTRNGAQCTTLFKRRDCSPPAQPCNLYVGENFCVRMHKYDFTLAKLVTDEADAGIMHTEFDPLRAVEAMTLSDHAQRIKNLPNAGGSSVLSEVMSFELLKRCYGAQLLKTEMEVSYFPEGGSITDYTCTMFNTTLGVSVTRAMKYRGDYTTEDATKLLNKKLTGIQQSSKNALEPWFKQILHVWATSKHVANIITRTFEATIPERVKANTVVIVTVAAQADEIFFNKQKG